MMKGIVYRIYPTEKQKEEFAKQFGSSRFVYNKCLHIKQTMYRKFRINIDESYLKKHLQILREIHPWLKDINQAAIACSVENLFVAYERFFKGVSGFPQYKKKDSKNSFCTPQEYKIDLTNSTIHIPKFGSCEIVMHIDILANANKETINITTNKKGYKILNQELNRSFLHAMTIKKTASGKYFVSIGIGYKDKELPEIQPFDESTTVGVDLGIKDFAILSNGEKIENPRYYKNSLKRSKCLQRRLSKKKGKANKEKARLAVAKINDNIANQRNDFQHKVSIKLIRENQAIAVETLNIEGMMKNHCLAQAIQDVSWGSFVSKLVYKAALYGKTILKIGRFEASSKTCHVCNWKYKDLTLDIREWTCPECGTHHDRDINAAINIKNFALRDYANITPMERREEPGDLLTRVEGMNQEAAML